MLEEEMWVYIDIEDLGFGIFEKVREYLFEVFFGSLWKGGMGLGFVIFYEFIEVYGGDFCLVCSDEIGIYFWIVFFYENIVC